jgi:hypothetical protein
MNVDIAWIGAPACPELTERHRNKLARALSRYQPERAQVRFERPPFPQLESESCTLDVFGSFGHRRVAVRAADFREAADIALERCQRELARALRTAAEPCTSPTAD